MATVILATSLVSIGRVGARSAMFALERLGHDVWFLPTVTLPFHPGHGPGTKIVPDTEMFAQLVEDIMERSDLDTVDAVMTGYLADPGQADVLARMIDAVRDTGADATILCDPVIGDDSGLYVPDSVARAQRDVLVPKADILTPNRFELEWLLGASLGSNEALAEAARTLPAQQVAVTSAFALMRGMAATLLVADGNAVLAEARAAEPAPRGPGDLFAALFLAHLLAGLASQDALTRAASSVHELVALAVRHGLQELPLPSDQAALTAPRLQVNLRHIRHVTA
ncbi:MAG: pyridoxal kinase [Pseudomonadota bacterium]